MTDKIVSFTSMRDGTKNDYRLLDQYEKDYIKLTGERILNYMEMMDQTLEGYRITRLEHALQSATRALRDQASKEMVVATLLHDIGDALAPANHSDFAAAILRHYVTEKTWWIIKHHGLFQQYYYGHHVGKDRNARDQYKTHPWYRDCVYFCEHWDQNSFDPDYPSLKLSDFSEMLLSVFKKPTQF
ncbi:MAG: peptidase, partial [Pseudomonadota bacterium]